MSGPAHVIGAVGFVGLDQTKRGLVARADASGAFVWAPMTPGDPAGWKIVDMGRDGAEALPLNAQESIQASDGQWLLINHLGFVYGASAFPSPTTAWTKLCIDSTTNRAHQHASGGKGGPRSTPSAVPAGERRPKSTSS